MKSAKNSKLKFRSSVDHSSQQPGEEEGRGSASVRVRTLKKLTLDRATFAGQKKPKQFRMVIKTEKVERETDGEKDLSENQLQPLRFQRPKSEFKIRPQTKNSNSGEEKVVGRKRVARPATTMKNRVLKNKQSFSRLSGPRRSSNSRGPLPQLQDQPFETTHFMSDNSNLSRNIQRLKNPKRGKKEVTQERNLSHNKLLQPQAHLEHSQHSNQSRTNLFRGRGMKTMNEMDRRSYKILAKHMQTQGQGTFSSHPNSPSNSNGQQQQPKLSKTQVHTPKGKRLNLKHRQHESTAKRLFLDLPIEENLGGPAVSRNLDEGGNGFQTQQWEDKMKKLRQFSSPSSMYEGHFSQQVPFMTRHSASNFVVPTMPMWPYPSFDMASQMTMQLPTQSFTAMQQPSFDLPYNVLSPLQHLQDPFLDPSLFQQRKMTAPGVNNLQPEFRSNLSEAAFNLKKIVNAKRNASGEGPWTANLQEENALSNHTVERQVPELPIHSLNQTETEVPHHELLMQAQFPFQMDEDVEDDQTETVRLRPSTLIAENQETTLIEMLKQKLKSLRGAKEEGQTEAIRVFSKALNLVQPEEHLQEETEINQLEIEVNEVLTDRHPTSSHQAEESDQPAQILSDQKKVDLVAETPCMLEIFSQPEVRVPEAKPEIRPAPFVRSSSDSTNSHANRLHNPRPDVGSVISDIRQGDRHVMSHFKLNEESELVDASDSYDIDHSQIMQTQNSKEKDKKTTLQESLGEISWDQIDADKPSVTEDDTISHSELSLASDQSYVMQLKEEIKRHDDQVFEHRKSLLKQFEQQSHKKVSTVNMESYFYSFSKVFAKRRSNLVGKPYRLSAEGFFNLYDRDIKDESDEVQREVKRISKGSFDYTFAYKYFETLEVKFGQILINKQNFKKRIGFLANGDKIRKVLLMAKRETNQRVMYGRKGNTRLFHRSIYPQRKLIYHYDVDFTKILDPLILIKMNRISQLPEEQDTKEQSKLKQIRNSAAYKIEKYLRRKNEVVLFDKSVSLKSLDIALMLKNKPINKGLWAFRRSKDRKVARAIARAVDEEMIATYIQQSDTIWRSKLVSEVLIVLLDETAIEAVTEPQKIVAAKMYAQTLNQSRQIDWIQVEDDARRREKRFAQALMRPESVALHKQLKNFEQIGYKLQLKSNLAKMNLKVCPIILNSIQSKKAKDSRIMPSTFKYKRALNVKAALLKIINRRFFPRRFESLLRAYNFKKSQLSLHESEHKMISRQLVKGQSESIKNHPIHKLLQRDEIAKFTGLIFSLRSSNIFRKLYKKENDLLVQNLQNRLSRMSVLGYSHLHQQKLKPRPSAVWQPLVFKHHRRMTLKTLPLGKAILHYQAQFKIFKKQLVDPWESMQTVDAIDQTSMELKQVREYQRQGAVNKYDDEMCQIMIMDELQQHVAQAKDCNGPYYKRVFKILNTCCKGSFIGHFGYKCKFIRDPEQPTYSMEVLKPALMENAAAKLRRYETKMRQKIPEAEGTAPDKSSIIEQWRERDRAETQQRISQQKELRVVQVPDLLTDQSLKDINFEDLQSDFDDEETSEMMEILNQHLGEEQLAKQREENIKISKLKMEGDEMGKKKVLQYYRNLPKDSEPSAASLPETKHQRRPFIAMTTEAYQEEFKHERKDGQLAQVRRVLGTTLHEVNNDNLEHLVNLRKEIRYMDKLKQQLEPKKAISLDLLPVDQPRKSTRGRAKSSTQLTLCHPKQSLIVPDNNSVSSVSFGRRTQMIKTPEISDQKNLDLNIKKDICQIRVEKGGSSSPNRRKRQQNRRSLRSSRSSSRRSAAPIINPDFQQDDLFLIDQEIKTIAQGLTNARLTDIDEYVSKIIKAQNKLLLKNELYLLDILKEKKRRLKKKDQKHVEKRFKILERMCKSSRTKGCQVKNERTQDQNKLLANVRIQKKLKCIIDRYGVKLNLKLPVRKRRLTKVMTKFELEILIKKQITYEQDFKNKLYKIVANQNVSHMEDIYKRYYITADNTKDELGNSLLALAVICNDVEMVSLFLSRGMSPNTKDNDGNTPLHCALNVMNRKITDLLIMHGADENLENNKGLTAWGSVASRQLTPDQELKYALHQ